MYYDAHTHLNSQQLYKRREKYRRAFIEMGGQWMVVVWIDPASNNQAIMLAEKTRWELLPIKITLGIHPHEIGHGSIHSKADVDAQIRTIEKQLKAFSQYVVAIGETGIDAHYPDYEKNKALQQYAFDKQCQLAQRYDLPIVIHSRDNFDDTLAIIKNYKHCKIYFHCRWYWPDQLAILHAQLPDLRVWFCWNLTYPTATQLQNSLTTAWKLQEKNKQNDAQLNTHSLKILFETDAPYLTPLIYKGKVNHPARIDAIYESASNLLAIPVLRLQKTIQKNYNSLYS